MLNTFLRFVVLLACCPTLCFAQEAGEPYRDGDYGFELQSPGAEWNFKRAADDSSIQRHVQFVLGSDSIDARLAVRSTKSLAAETVKELRAAYREAIAQEPGVSELKPIERVIDGRETLGLAMHVESGGLEYELRHHYWIEGKRQFVLEDLYLSENESMAEVVDDAWSGFAFREVAGPTEDEALLEELAGRCGSEVVLSEDWESASERAREEGKLVLVAVHLLPGFDIEGPWMQGHFMDEDFIDLLNERYVPLMYKRGLGAPFEEQEVYGMSNSSFGTALLVVDPDGNVVGETREDLDGFLRRELAARATEQELGELFDSKDPLELAEHFVRRGEFAEARRVLEGQRSARAHLVASEMARRDLEREAWGAALELARGAEDASDFDYELERATAQYEIAMNRPDEARKILERLLEAYPEREDIQEVSFGLGALDFADEDLERARERWMELCREHPESRWAWQAAATIRSTLFKAGKGTRLHWPPQEYFEAQRHPAPEPGNHKEVEQVIAQAVDFLLEGQVADGHWICAGEAADDPWDENQKNLTEAVTCLAARSLLAHRDRDGVTLAIERALDHVIRRLEHDLVQEPQILYMDYTVWNRACQLHLFTQCLELGFGDRERIEAACALVLDDLRARQHKGGGWSYFISGSLEGSGNPITQSISFTTAFVIVALAEAVDLDLETPEGLVADAVDCLERMRNDDGPFVYMLHHGSESAGRSTTIQSGAGRGPLCSYALMRHGRSSTRELWQNLKTYADHHAGLTHQVGRALMHAGPHAEGSHWVLFDYATAAEALGELPRRKTGKFRELILTDLLEARRADGSFLDNQLIGRHCGTALALIAFEHLQ